MEWKEIIGVVDTDQSTFCICTHHIHECYYVKNRKNHNILRIGSDCIEKFGSKDLKHKCRALIKQIKYLKRGDYKHRFCAGCLKHNISVDEPEWKKVCKSCYKNGITSDLSILLINSFAKECIDCNCTLPNESEEWKTRCFKCYIKNKTKNTNSIDRICDTCKLPLLKTLEKWKTKCYHCYKISRDVNQLEISKEEKKSYISNQQQR